MNIDTGKIPLFVTLLILSYIWLGLVAWVNIDSRKKARNTKFCNTLVFFLGPIGISIYYLFPSLFELQTVSRKMDSTGRYSKANDDDKQVLQIVDKLLHDAIAYRATDIHMEPSKERLTIRFRIDGFLYEYRSFPSDIGKSIISATFFGLYRVRLLLLSRI